MCEYIDHVFYSLVATIFIVVSGFVAAYWN